MKKILAIFSLLLLSLLSFFLFHNKGNELILPLLSKYLTAQSDGKVQIEVTHLQIDLNKQKIVATINKDALLHAQGQISPFSKTVNMDYNITSSKKIDVHGKVKGLFDNLTIDGKGNAFSSKLNYSLNLQGEDIQDVNVILHQAQLSEILLLAGEPAYAKGLIDVDVNIPKVEERETKGKAHLLLHKIAFNEKILKKEFKINLPKATTLSGDINAMLNKKSLELNGELKSNLANLTLNNTHYQLKEKSLSTNYVLSIPELSKLSNILKQKLRGKFRLNGSLKLKGEQLTLSGTSKSLGGETNILLKNKKLNLQLERAELTKLFYLFAMEPYATGYLNSTVKISDLSNLKGEVTLNTQEAKTIHATLKKALNLDLGKATSFTLKTNGNIASNLANIKTNFNSELFNLQSENMRYDLKNGSLNATYLLAVPKLSKLKHLAGKELQGRVDVTGKIELNKTVLITGLTKSLGGEIDFKLQEQQITSHMSNVSTQKLMTMLRYPQIFKAPLVGQFDYNLKKSQGTFKAELQKAQLLPNTLTRLIKQIQGLDLTKERYNKTILTSQLNRDKIDFDFKAQSKTVLLAINKGKINKASNTINAPFIINIDNKDIGGKIKGDISNPKVTLDSSNFIKDKVLNAIDKYIGEDKLKELGIDKKGKEVIENIFGDLFK